MHVVAAPEHPAPVKPANALSASGCAVSVTPLLSVAEHVGCAAVSVPQSIPDGVESTKPPPDPASSTARSNVGW